MKLIRYWATLNRRTFILWTAFLWYAAIVIFTLDQNHSAWLRSLGIAAIVGSILTINAIPENGRWRDVGFWAGFRFFLIPFCVSSFSALTKDRDYFLIFPLSLRENLIAGGVIAGFAGGVLATRLLCRPRATRSQGE